MRALPMACPVEFLQPSINRQEIGDGGHGTTEASASLYHKWAANQSWSGLFSRPPDSPQEEAASGSQARNISIPLASLNPQAGVEGIAQAVAQEIQAQPRQGEGGAREEAHPVGFADGVLAAGDHVALRRHVGRHSHAEKAQDRLGQDGKGEDERSLDEQGAHAVGEDMPVGQGEIPAPEGEGGLSGLADFLIGADPFLLISESGENR